MFDVIRFVIRTVTKSLEPARVMPIHLNESMDKNSKAHFLLVEQAG